MGTLNKLVFVKLMSIFVSIVTGENEYDLPCKFTDSVNITEGILQNGSILHNNLLYKSENYALINYTADSGGIITVDNYYYRGCICQVKNCVWLCCDNYKDIGGIPSCIDDTSITELLVEVVDKPGVSYEMDLVRNSSFHVAPRVSSRDSEGSLYGFEKGEWSMNSTGFVQLMVEPYYLAQESHCLSNSFTVYGRIDSYDSEIYVNTKIQITALIISLPFMLVTLFIYLCIAELRNIHGKCLICYVLSMICCFSILLFTKFEGQLYYCYYYQYFWTMAGFFWLNVLCFDIFWTFSSGIVKNRERKRFWYYSLYAWGCPMILLAMLVVIDNTSFVPENFRPQISSDFCYFGGELWVPLIYLYSILIVLILVNILFFVITLTRIIGIQRATDAVLQRGSRRHSSVENRYRIHMYLRLFVVMGVMWIFEVISFAICPEGSCMNVTDVLNCLLGVFIFLMFVCKSNVKQMILKRIGRNTSLRRSKSNYTISTSGISTKEATIPLRQLSRTESDPAKYSNDRYY